MKMLIEDVFLPINFTLAAHLPAIGEAVASRVVDLWGLVRLRVILSVEKISIDGVTRGCICKVIFCNWLPPRESLIGRFGRSEIPALNKKEKE